MVLTFLCNKNSSIVALGEEGVLDNASVLIKCGVDIVDVCVVSKSGRYISGYDDVITFVFPEVVTGALFSVSGFLESLGSESRRSLQVCMNSSSLSMIQALMLDINI